MRSNGPQAKLRRESFIISFIIYTYNTLVIVVLAALYSNSFRKGNDRRVFLKRVSCFCARDRSLNLCNGNPLNPNNLKHHRDSWIVQRTFDNQSNSSGCFQFIIHNQMTEQDGMLWNVSMSAEIGLTRWMVSQKNLYILAVVFESFCSRRLTISSKLRLAHDILPSTINSVNVLTVSMAFEIPWARY